jgi:hypothetical protein
MRSRENKMLEGKRAALRRLLARGDEARIAACTDEAALDAWFDKALGATTAHAVLA